MTREEILALLDKARDVGAVKHVDFVDYVVVLEGRRKVQGQWQTTEHAYMTIDGKLAMANEDHRKQAKRLDFGEPKVLVDSSEQLTLQVTVTSEIYGVRHGIATSRKKIGTNAEKDWPWEVAETSSIGRALAAMGYGLLPGSGLAGAEDLMHTEVTSSRDEEKTTNHNGNGNHICTTHQVAMEQMPKGWAHRLKGGSLCYGPRNGFSLTSIAPSNHSAAVKSV